jgi:hypothetical protein
MGSDRARERAEESKLEILQKFHSFRGFPHSRRQSRFCPNLTRPWPRVEHVQFPPEPVAVRVSFQSNTLVLTGKSWARAY